MKKGTRKQRWLIRLLGSLSLGILPGMVFAQMSVNPRVAEVGPASKVPVAIQNVRWEMLDGNINTLTFRSMDTLFTTRNVSRAGAVSPTGHSGTKSHYITG